jgi:hypothetical protein
MDVFLSRRGTGCSGSSLAEALVFLSRIYGNGRLWDIFHHLAIRLLLVASHSMSVPPV